MVRWTQTPEIADMAAVQTPPASRSGSAQDQYARVQLSGLRKGATLRAPIFEDRDDNLLLLLASGTTLTESLLSRLARRGISHVRVHPNELQQLVAVGSGEALPTAGSTTQRSRLAQQAIRRAESETQRSAKTQWTSSPDSFVHKVALHGVAPYNAASRDKLLTNYRATVVQVETLFEGLSLGEIKDASTMAAVSSESLIRIADDLDLFVALGLTPATDKYPCKHSLQTAMLAMSIGTILGLKLDDLIELGIGCLVHDAGMLHIRPELVQAQRPLNRIEFLEVARHPVFTFDRLRDVKEVPNASRLVAYQMHERLDGGGYPRGRTANQIHRLAKIAAVADVFVALLSPRPYRPQMLPYHAMEQIIHGARQGKYDPHVVRALLHTVSLFPIGSYVEINNGSIGKVIRSNREAYSTPIVELWTPDSAQAPARLVDLSSETELKIVRPLADVPDMTTDKDATALSDHWT